MLDIKNALSENNKRKKQKKCLGSHLCKLDGCITNLCALGATVLNMRKGTRPHYSGNGRGLDTQLVSLLDHLIFAWIFCLSCEGQQTQHAHCD